MDDRFDSPALSDFPSDPPPNHDLLIWLFITLFLVALVAALVVVFKRAERHGGSSAIEKRAKAVMEFLSPGAKASLDGQIDTAIKSRAAIEAQFGETLKLSHALSKIAGQLNGAVEGTEKKAYTPKGAAGPAQINGGTYINIAIGADGQLQPQPAPPPAAKAEKVPMSPEEQSTAIWFAVQKLFDYWKNLMVVTESYRTALRQLSDSPAWEPPEEDPRLAPKGRKPS